MADYIFAASEDGFGRVLIPRGQWDPSLAELIRDEKVEALRLTESMGWRGTEVDFLRGLRTLKSVEIYSQKVRDLSALATLGDLRVVGLQCQPRVDVDLAPLTRLEVVKANWMPGLRPVLQRATLRRLNVTSWPDSDFRALTHLEALERLQVTSRTLSSLEGIEELPSLEWVDLHDCPKLTDLAALASCPQLKRVELTSCKGVLDISSMSSLAGLRELFLDDDRDIATLTPLRQCRSLVTLSFLGTTRIVDGDLSFIEDLPELQTLRFAPRRHYNRSREELVRG